MRMPAIRLPQVIIQPTSFYVILLAVTVLALFFGVFIALFPPSFTSRVVIVVGAGIVLFVSMVIPFRDHGSNNRLLMLFLVATVFLAFLWPRYSFLKLSEHLPRLSPLGVLEFLSMLTMLLFWMKSKLMRAELAFALRGSKAIVAFFLMFVIWRFIANSFGEFAWASLSLYAREIVYTFSFFAIGLLLGGRPQGVRLIAVILAVAAAIVSALAVVEYVTHFNVFTKLAVSEEQGALGAQLQLTTMQKLRAGAYRAQASFDHPILLAQFAAAFLPVMIQLYRGEVSFLRKTASFAGIVLLLGGTFVARSRTGVAVLALSFGLYLVLEIVSRMRIETRGRGLAAIAAIAVLIVSLLLSISLIGPYIAEVVVGRDTTEMASTNARLQMAAVAVPQVLESPLVGYGQGTAVFLAGMGSGYVVTLDSYYLTLLLDNGIPGLLLFSGLCISIWLRSLSCVGAALEQQLAGAFGIAVLAIYLSLSIVSIPNNTILVYLFGGALCAFAARMTKEHPIEKLSGAVMRLRGR